MTELLVQYRSKIDWLNYKDWTYGSNWSFDIDSLGQYTADVNGIGNLSKRGLVQLGKKYKISFEITNYTSGKVRFNTGSHLSDWKSGDGVYDFTYTMYNDDFVIKGSNSSNLSVKNIVIEEIGYSNLDLFEDTQIALNYQFKDIQDIGSNKGNYTKEIRIPGSPTNNRFFKYVFNINNDNVFNMGAKCNATLQFGDSIMDGYLKLESIIALDDNKNYVVIFYSETVNLWNDIGDDTFDVLDFSDENHTLDYDTVKNSWRTFNTTAVNYVYPYIDYGDGKERLDGVQGSAFDTTGFGLICSDLYPAIRVAYIYKKIFDHYGYTLTSSFIDDNPFNKMIIPFCQRQDILDDWNKIAKIETVSGYRKHRELLGNNLQVNGKFKLNTSYNTLNDSIISRTDDFHLTKTLDSYNGFNITNTIFQKILPGTYSITIAGKYKIKCNLKILDNTTHNTINVYAFKLKGNVTDLYTLYQSPNYFFKVLTDHEEITELHSTSFSSTNYLPLETEFDCDIGDIIGIKVVATTAFYPTDNLVVQLDYIEIQKFGYFNGASIDMNVVKDSKMKIKDFLSSINKMFNLTYVYHNNEIVVEPYNTYMDNYGEIRNWTKKLDKDKDIKIELPKDYLNSYYNFKYKDADDYWNSYWNSQKDQVGLGYGGKKIKVDNEFLKTDISIEPIFKPTAMRSNWASLHPQFTFPIYQNYSYPQETFSYERNTNIGPRILYFKWEKVYFGNQAFRFEGKDFHGEVDYHYPYCGHLTEPTNALSANAYDLNYSFKDKVDGVWQPLFRTYPLIPLTINQDNLYNLYWKKYIEEISDKDARLVTAWFDLKINDLNDFQFADKILVDGTYYRVHKIIDFKPDGNTLTKVELIKVKDVTISYSNITSDADDEITITNDISSFSLGSNNVLNEKSLAIGDGNYSNSEKSSLIVGDDNTGGRIVVGDDNQINSLSSVINSDDIIISDTGVTAVVIGESDKTINQDGVYIDGIRISDGVITRENVILDPNSYVRGVRTIIDGGENGMDDFNYDGVKIIDPNKK